MAMKGKHTICQNHCNMKKREKNDEYIDEFSRETGTLIEHNGFHFVYIFRGLNLIEIKDFLSS